MIIEVIKIRFIQYLAVYRGLRCVLTHVIFIITLYVVDVNLEMFCYKNLLFILLLDILSFILHIETK